MFPRPQSASRWEEVKSYSINLWRKNSKTNCGTVAGLRCSGLALASIVVQVVDVDDEEKVGGAGEKGKAAANSSSIKYVYCTVAAVEN